MPLRPTIEIPGRRRLLRAATAAGALGGCRWLAACAQPAVRHTTPAGEEIADNPLATSASNQAATLRNIDQLAPTRAVLRGARVLPLPPHPRDGSTRDFAFDFQGTRYTVDDFMGRNRVAGILVLKDGAVALERYAMGNTADTRWTSFSIAKSIVSTLVGAALRDGSIDSLDDTVGTYVEALRGSAYADSRLRDLLSMTSGIAWEEDYSILHGSDILRFARAIASRTPGAVLALMRSRERAAPSGTVFNYSTGDSYVLGTVLAAATGVNLSSYLSDTIWSRWGMERDAYWLLDAPDGLETGGNEISATLRDYGRFGLFFLEEGRVDGEMLLPPGWRDEATRPGTAVASYGQVDDDPLGYGYQWWCFPDGDGALPHHEGAFTAQGIFGQFLYINPRERVVAVVWSAWRSPWEDRAEMETYAMIGEAVALLQDTAAGPGGTTPNARALASAPRARR